MNWFQMATQRRRKMPAAHERSDMARWCVTAGVCMACVGASIACTDDAVRPRADAKERSDIAFDDLSGMRIIGRLGKPLGTYCSLRGQWKSDWARAKTVLWWFRVTHLDGEELEKAIEFPAFHVEAQPGRGQKALKDAREGEIWELRAYEGITTYGSPPGYFEESGFAQGAGSLPFELSSRLHYVKGVSLGADSKSKGD